MDAETDINGHGGAREGAGRKPGRPSLRRAAQAIAEVEEAFPGWSPVLHLAAVANDEELPADVRLDAAKAAAPYLHSRPKPVEMEPDALVELERRLMAVRIEVAAEAVKHDEGLAERLARAKKRKLAAEVIEVFDALADAADAAAPLIDACPAPVAPTPAPATPVQPEPAPEPYRPILPRPAPAATTDWAAPRVDWPEEQAFVDGGRSSFTSDPYSADPLGFLANR
ncbi:hypothetical protein PE067_18265 [Paracoccus sp. DMF-8]|uniref:hypothetical protein n=1 Tax=Paracoccus sp. DMF-8 TaxID=3019445 RepID=UPI0023E44848|nr:hypothetical protein [Paracoccus sp. DMF-8]MDF3607911.1 hypothetical protein [Paracoccus sp. DMF-8]